MSLLMAQEISGGAFGYLKDGTVRPRGGLYRC